MEFKRDIVINGRTIQAFVKITVEQEYDFDISDWEDATDQARIKSGELFVAWVQVLSFALGIEGCDSISWCTLRPNNMFNSEPFESDLKSILEDYNMIENSLMDLEKNIRDQAKLLKGLE
jgi:hypothetical protein